MKGPPAATLPSGGGLRLVALVAGAAAAYAVGRVLRLSEPWMVAALMAFAVQGAHGLLLALRERGRLAALRPVLVTVQTLVLWAALWMILSTSARQPSVWRATLTAAAVVVLMVAAERWMFRREEAW